MTVLNRYRVIGTWGEVPQQIKDIIGKADAFLVYPEYRGRRSQQTFFSHGEIVGGWAMEYAGKTPDEATA